MVSFAVDTINLNVLKMLEEGPTINNNSTVRMCGVRNHIFRGENFCNGHCIHFNNEVFDIYVLC